MPAASLTTPGPVSTKLGVPSLSVIVAVPVALALLVIPALVVAVRVKFSDGSLILSLIIGVRTSTLVVLAAIVAVVALFQVRPPSVDTSRLVGPAEPKSVPAPIAVPLLRVKLKLEATLDGFDKLTVNTA